MTDKSWREWVGAAAWFGGHVVAVAVLATALAFVVVPYKMAVPVAEMVVSIPQVWDMSVPYLLLHVGVSACIWTLGVIMFRLGQMRWQEMKASKTKTVRLSKGTVVTETLIVMPVFLLLTFGLAQLTINNIAGVLANVAGYQAARAVWVWQPEADAGRMGVNNEKVKERARIAIAMVMTPVAPGDFVGDPTLPDDAAAARMALLAAHVPFGDEVAGYFGDVGELLGVGLAADLTIATQSNLRVTRALDESTFAHRTAKKFTHAFHASDVSFDPGADPYEVTMTYQHMQAMPLVGRIFGESRAPELSFDIGAEQLEGVGGRWGYYAQYERTIALPQQKHAVNPDLPSNDSEPVEPEGSEPNEDGVADHVEDESPDDGG